MKMMTDYLLDAYNWIKALFIKPEHAPNTKKAKQEYEDAPGQFKTIRELMDSLDETFDNLKLLSPKKGEFQKILTRFGAFVTGEGNYDIPATVLQGFEAYGLPAYICNYIPHRDKVKDANGEYFVNSFFCANKMKSIPELVCDSKKYVYYECADVLIVDKKKAYDASFVIAVDKKTGDIVPMKLPYRVPHTVGHGKHRDTFYTKEWQFPDLRNASVVNDDKGRRLENALTRHLSFRFALSYNMTMLREFGVNIIVKKGKYRATFTVPQDRWKYFFKERIKAKNKHGNTKRIFHSVSSHARRTKKGIVPVKTHYRGLRSFFWKGYDISIVMQGKHGISQAEFGVAGIDEIDMEEKTEYYDIDGIADSLNDCFEHGKPAL